jgi:hypothetical protein
MVLVLDLKSNLNDQNLIKLIKRRFVQLKLKKNYKSSTIRQFIALILRYCQNKPCFNENH